eukprot:TRINITY_DN5646_c0_g3_i6.p2 TRINITY_DN5646_c0_g3~~TRINITY_DN5646_c0_g3_i6.p2  ORF type:complete len:157 (+),score=46.60 TRINITY_DN5646_c0_g3_i6:640-1110(+)
MAKEDVPQVHALLAEYLKKFKLYEIYTEERVAHMLLPRKDVIHTYVVTSADGKVTDFISFYITDYTVLKHPSIKESKSGYLYYYAFTKTPLAKLVNAAMHHAIKLGVDSFITSDYMDNAQFLKELNFKWLNDCQQVYLYNYSFRSISSNELGVHFI